MMLFFRLLGRQGGSFRERTGWGSWLNPLCHAVLLCQRRYQTFIFHPLSFCISPTFNPICSDSNRRSEPLTSRSIFLNSVSFFILSPPSSPVCFPPSLSLSLGWGLSAIEQTGSLCFARAMRAKQRGGLFHWNLDRISIHRGKNRGPAGTLNASGKHGWTVGEGWNGKNNQYQKTQRDREKVTLGHRLS